MTMTLGLRLGHSPSRRNLWVLPSTDSKAKASSADPASDHPFEKEKKRVIRDERQCLYLIFCVALGAFFFPIVCPPPGIENE
mmetsp:Transcript_26488/g.61658  ORF Transcript_26488/g.61658 Transcript_26488/m.61658 type:complete len:82 (-) Transcript_26488:99-344(-)